MPSSGISVLVLSTPITCGIELNGSTVGKAHYFDSVSGGDLFNLTVSEPLLLSVSTCASSDFDTVLKIYDENYFLLCENDNACGNQSALSCEIAGGSNFILVTGSGTEEGFYDLDVSCTTGLWKVLVLFTQYCRSTETAMR